MSNLGRAAELEKQGDFSAAADIYESLARMEGPEKGSDLYLLAEECRKSAGQQSGHNYSAPYRTPEERQARRIKRVRKDHFYTVLYVLAALVLIYIILSPFIAMGINRAAGY